MTTKKSQLPSIALVLLLVGFGSAFVSVSDRGSMIPAQPPEPAAATLREFIAQGPDPVDAEISDALQYWSIALNGH